MGITRRRFQMRLLHFMGAITGLGVFFACLSGHLGFGFQVGAVLVGFAGGAAAVVFLYLTAMRFLYVQFPRLVANSLRRKEELPADSPSIESNLHGATTGDEESTTRGDKPV